MGSISSGRSRHRSTEPGRGEPPGPSLHTEWVDADGWIVPVADRCSLQAEYAGVPATVARVLSDGLGARLHSAYLFGSVARGAARPGESDLDVLAILADRRPTDGASVEHLTGRIVDAEAAVPSVDLIVRDLPTVSAPEMLHEWGVFIHAVCVPVAGHDLRPEFPAFRPTVEVAHGLTRAVFPSKLHEARALLAGDPSREELAWASRKLRWLVRAAFSLVIARFGAWSPVLEEQADLVASAFPGWSDDVHGCVELARRPPHGREPLDRLLDGFGAELEARYWETFGSS